MAVPEQGELFPQRRAGHDHPVQPPLLEGQTSLEPLITDRLSAIVSSFTQRPSQIIDIHPTWMFLKVSGYLQHGHRVAGDQVRPKLISDGALHLFPTCHSIFVLEPPAGFSICWGVVRSWEVSLLSSASSPNAQNALGCGHADKCMQDAIEYNKKRWDKTHKEPNFQIGEKFIISTLNFNNLGGNKKFKPAFIGPFVIKKLHGKNAVEVILTEELSKKHPVFPVSLIKP